MAEIHGASLNGEVLYEKSDHPFDTDGWVKAEDGGINGTNNLYYSIKNSVLYVFGSVNTGAGGFIKVNPKWKLPAGAMFTEVLNNSSMGRADAHEYYVGTDSDWANDDYLINLNTTGDTTFYAFNFSLPIA